jgi:SAM-dependent methyltransferase
MTAPNQAEYDDWNGENGQRWVADADRRDRVLDAVATAVLDAARIQPGENVLDIGCGCGATTIAEAKAAGSGGSVDGIDISEVMLSVARTRLDQAHLDTIRLVAADAQTHPFEAARYDVAVSRFGTMFFDDPVAAFTNIGRGLRSGGRLCLATWQPLVANDWLTIPGAELLRFGSLPNGDGEGPGMFAQSEPETLTAVLTAAGFVDINARPVTVVLRLGDDPADATDYLAAGGPGRAVLATITEADRPAALDAVRQALTAYHGADGVHLNGAVLITTAMRPG